MRVPCSKRGHRRDVTAAQSVIFTSFSLSWLCTAAYFLRQWIYSASPASMAKYENTQALFADNRERLVDGGSDVQYLDCFYVKCTVYNNGQWAAHSDLFDSKFRDRFSSPSVKGFMTQFVSRCRPDQPLFGAFLENTVFRGFGSGIAIAVGAYNIAEAASKRFQIVFYNWFYRPLSTYFDDFAAGSHCPIFRNLSDHDAAYLLQRKDNCTVKYINGTVVIDSNLDTAPPHGWRCFNEMRHVISVLYSQNPDVAFQTRSLLTRSIWQLQPALRNFVKVLLSSFLMDGFIGVHIRKGDKVTTGEMDNIPVQRYVDKIQSLSGKNRSLKRVYVMADEHSSYFAVKRILKRDSFTVHNIQELIRLHQFEPEDILVRPVNDLTHQAPMPASNENYWHRHTGQIIAELTILALANEVVCTMSSNLCLLAALLRGDRNETIHSLDSPWRSP